MEEIDRTGDSEGEGGRVLTGWEKRDYSSCEISDLTHFYRGTMITRMAWTTCPRSMTYGVHPVG